MPRRTRHGPSAQRPWRGSRQRTTDVTEVVPDSRATTGAASQGSACRAGVSACGVPARAANGLAWPTRGEPRQDRPHHPDRRGEPIHRCRRLGQEPLTAMADVPPLAMRVDANPSIGPTRRVGPTTNAGRRGGKGNGGTCSPGKTRASGLSNSLHVVVECYPRYRESIKSRTWTDIPDKGPLNLWMAMSSDSTHTRIGFYEVLIDGVFLLLHGSPSAFLALLMSQRALGSRTPYDSSDTTTLPKHFGQ